MTDKKKRLLLLICGVAVLTAILAGVLFSCRKPAEETPDTPPASSTAGEKMTYTIELTTEGGMALEEVGIYIYTDETQEELVWFAKTDAEGKITFTDAASDSYVAVLSGAPEGYQVEEYYPLTGELTQIVLAAGSGDADLANITYELGDAMLNFSVTTPDGNVHTLSEILKEKKAVVLNFWYLQCQPCKMEFPYLQEAYEKYSEDIEVLAMNPVNTEDEEIAAFQKEQGYTFPMALCDPAWEKAMQLTAYPTTVVVDRFGTISFIHEGSVPDVETFENIFEFYGSDDYEQTVILESLEDLQEQLDKQTVGSSDTPLEVGGVTSFNVTVEPGQLVYVNLYKVTDMTLSLNNPNAYVTYNGYTYDNSGWISFTVTTPDTYTPAKLVFGNSGEETQTYTVRLAPKAGSVNNPYTMALGEMTANVGAGNDQGVYYNYKATGDGLLKVEVLSATEGINYDIILYNLNSYAQRTLRGEGQKDPDTGTTTFGINVKAGQTVQMIVGTLPDSSNSYPAGSFKLKISFGEGESEGSSMIEEKITYAVTVTDENRKPVPGVMLDLTIDDGTATITTDENGIASTKRVAGTYPVTLRVPKGYTADATQFQFTEELTTFSIKLNTLVENWETYTVTVVDEAGTPIPGALVTIDTTYIQTDTNGQASFELLKGSYTAKITAPEGYAAEENGYAFAEGATELTVTLKKGEGGPAVEKADYTVTVVDASGNAMTNVSKVTFLKDGAAAAIVTEVTAGAATAKLNPGSYTVSVEFASGNYYYAPATLSETNRTAQITVLPMISVEDGVGAEMETLYVGEGVYNAFHVDPGVVYVDLEESRYNYFLFTPTVQGEYVVSVGDPTAKLSYWGGNTFYVSEQKDMVNADNTITLNVKPNHLGDGSGQSVTYIIGITGSGTTLSITRIGDAILDETDLVPEEYEPKTAPKAYTLRIPSGKQLTYVDVVNGVADDYKIYKGRDGYYHLGSAAGPIMYVNLGTDAPYLSLSNFLGVTDSYAANNLSYTFYENGVAVRKESYTNTMIEFVNCRDANTGVYPLTDDLMYMLQMGGEHRGMWDIDNPNYIFLDSNGDPIEVNFDIAWMFACCYLN